MRIIKLVGVFAFAVAGCAPRYSWYNPGVDQTVAQRQREIDTAECTTVAMQSIPLPALPMRSAPAAAPAPSNYSVSGTTTVYGANGETYTGFYSGTANGGGLNYESPAQAQIEGAEASQAMIDSYRRDQAYRAQDQLAEACMMRRGWTKVLAGQQPILAPAPPSQNAMDAPTASSVASAEFPAVQPPAPVQRYDQWQKNNGSGTSK